MGFIRNRAHRFSGTYEALSHGNETDGVGKASQPDALRASAHHAGGVEDDGIVIAHRLDAQHVIAMQG
jgi:hypothetical protein